MGLLQLASIINVSSGQCWVSKLNNPVPGVTPGAPANNGYEGGFAIELCRKVLSLAVGTGEPAEPPSCQWADADAGETADLVGAKLVLKDATLAAFDEAIQDPNCAGRDARVMYRWLGGDA